MRARFAIGPQPHPIFIEVSRPAPVGDAYWEVEGAGRMGDPRAEVS
jgi:hypothetical protein